jgi:hypothetical protein
VGRVGYADLRDGERNTLIQEQKLQKKLACYCKPCYNGIKEKSRTSGKGGRRMYDLNSGKFVPISKTVARRLFDQGRMVYLTPSYIAIDRFKLQFRPAPIPYDARSFDYAVIDFERQNWQYTYLANFWIIKNREWEERKMEHILREIFDLERIQEYAEANIDLTEWIEEEYGEKRKILLITTLVSGGHGAYIPGIVLDLFGQAEGYDLEDPYNLEANETIYDALMFLEDEVNECLNRLIPSKGTYYIGYHEADGSYCLFYMETEKGDQ